MMSNEDNEPMMTHDNMTTNKLEITTTDLDHNLNGWSVQDLVSEGDNVAWIADLDNDQRHNLSVFYNGERIAGPFYDAWSLVLKNGVLAWVTRQERGGFRAYVACKNSDGKIKVSSLGRLFNLIQNLQIHGDGDVYFTAQGPHPIIGGTTDYSFVLRNGGTIGEHHKLDYGVVRCGEHIVYLAQDRSGWWLYSCSPTGDQAKRVTGPFDLAFGLQVEHHHLHFVVRRDDSYQVILDKEAVGEHRTQPYSCHYDGHILTYLVCETNDPEEGASVFCNGQKLGGPYEDAMVNSQNGMIWALVQEWEDHKYYLLHDGNRVAGPFQCADELEVLDTDQVFYLAVPDGCAPGGNHLMSGRDQLWSVSSAAYQFYRFDDILMTTYKFVDTFTMVKIAGQRVNHYLRTSKPWAEDDGRIAFHALTTRNVLTKVTITPS